jgi:hypothetical protein
MSSVKAVSFTIPEAHDALRRSGLGLPLSKAIGLVLLCGGDLGGQCLQYPRRDWKHEVKNAAVSKGYWTWAAEKFEKSYGPIIEEREDPEVQSEMDCAIAGLVARCGGDPNAACLQYPRSWWRDEVESGDTELGYWEWVVHQAEGAGVELEDLTKF